MTTQDGVTRRDFVATASGAAVASLLPGRAAAAGRRRYAIVGTGVRGIGMWGKPLVAKYGDVLEFVGLCDINPLRVEVAKKSIGVDCPTFTSLDEMLDKAKPELLMVTTVDATHEGCIVKALDRGHRRPHREADGHRRDAVPVRARRGEAHGPPDRRDLQLPLRAEAPEDQGDPASRARSAQVTSVDFSWYLDTQPRRRLLPPLAPPAGEGRVALGAQGHPPLRPRQLVARRRPRGGLGLRQPAALRQEGPVPPHELPALPPQGAVLRSTGTSRRTRSLVALYVDCEKADGYLRDGCVFKEDVNIPDTMNAVVRYSNGVTMSYSLNAFMPIEGYRLAFNGTKGRLEVRDYERQPWTGARGDGDPPHPELRRAGRRSTIPKARGRPRRR